MDQTDNIEENRNSREPLPAEIPFIPNPKDKNFIPLLGLELVVDNLIHERNSKNSKYVYDSSAAEQESQSLTQIRARIERQKRELRHLRRRLLYDQNKLDQSNSPNLLPPVSSLKPTQIVPQLPPVVSATVSSPAMEKQPVPDMDCMPSTSKAALERYRKEKEAKAKQL